jgi:hypothetical protein
MANADVVVVRVTLRITGAGFMCGSKCQLECSNVNKSSVLMMTMMTPCYLQ